jgi:hypothetical protein
MLIIKTIAIQNLICVQNKDNCPYSLFNPKLKSTDNVEFYIRY